MRADTPVSVRVALRELGRLAQELGGEETRLASALGLPEEFDGPNGVRPACVERISDRKQRILLTQLNWLRLPLCVQENLEVIRCTPGSRTVDIAGAPR